MGIRFNLVEVKAPNGYPVHNLDTGLNYTTIQDAIDAPETLDEHTIFVGAGTYKESLIVNKSLNLIGEDPVSTVINGHGTVISIESDCVRIENLTVEGTGYWEGYHDIITLGRNNITIQNNNIFGGSSSWQNIIKVRSSNNIISGNNMTGGGIELSGANNTILRNNWINNTHGYCFGVFGNLEELVSLSIDESNVYANGKRIYYWTNRKDAIIPADAGYVGLVNCTNITVANLDLRHNVQGILLAYTTDSQVIGNTIKDHRHAVWVEHSSNNSISSNTIDDIIITDGIVLSSSSYNNISYNSLSHVYGDGIRLSDSPSNTIFGNSVVVAGSDQCGIRLDNSSNNRISHNNFDFELHDVPFNLAHASDSYNNSWDDGYPWGGNYWGNYDGSDMNHDGIGDTPYIIDNNNKDNYPLMYQNETWEKSALIVDPFYTEWSFKKDIMYKVQDYLENSGYSVSVMRDENVTVEWLKDGLRHGVVLWRGHTALSPIGLITGEKVTEENTQKYKEDIENDRIGKISKGSIYYWAIKTEFLRHYYTTNRLPNSLIVVEGCSSLSDTSLASAFIEVSARSYIGYTMEVQEPLTSFDMRTLFKNLCERGYTVKEAVNSVFWGKDVLQYYGDPELKLTTLIDSTTSIGFAVHSPANLYVIDPEGRHIGLDPTTNQSVNDFLPDGIYTGSETEPQVIWIPDALNGTYQIVLTGTITGTYNLIVGMSSSLQTKTESQLGMITANQTITLAINVTETGFTIVPEFPSFLILSLFMIATLLAVIFYRRKHTLDNSAVHLSEMSNPSM